MTTRAPAGRATHRHRDTGRLVYAEPATLGTVHIWTATGAQRRIIGRDFRRDYEPLQGGPHR